MSTKSRGDRITEAEELSDSAPEVLWTLALSPRVLRRAQIVEWSGATEAAVLKILARLANSEFLSPTDGLLFALADRELAAELTRKMPADRRVTLQARAVDLCLQAGRPQEEILHHALGAGDWVLAGSLVDDLWRAADNDPTRRQMLVPSLRSLFQGFEQADPRDLAKIFHFGLRLLEAGTTELRPREAKLLIERLKELCPDESRRQHIISLEGQVAEARAAARTRETASVAAGNELPLTTASVNGSPAP